jgi:hypothetical protein
MLANSEPSVTEMVGYLLQTGCAKVDIDSLLKNRKCDLLQVAGDVPSELFPSRAGYLLGC